MTEVVNELTERRRRDGRRVGWFAVGAVLLMVGMIVFVWLRDVGPPDDVAMLPVFTEGGGEGNVLLQFVEELMLLPPSGYNELIPFPGGDSESASHEELTKLVALLQNVKRLGLWRWLMASDVDGWRWRMQDPEQQGFYGEFPAWHFLEISHVVDFQSRLLVSERKTAEAAEMALGIWRMGDGLMNTEGPMSNWNAACEVESIGIHALHQALADGEANEAMLADMQRQMALRKGRVLHSLGEALKVEYQQMKEVTLRLREDTFAGRTGLNRLKLTLTFKANHTLRTFLFYVQPIMEACSKEGDQMIQAGKEIERHLREIDRQSWHQRIRPNGYGQWLVDVELSRLMGISEQGVLTELKSQLTQIMLAIRRFELKHGRLPAGEKELVPEFMEAWPVDPFDDQPLRWDIARQRIYSVSKDGRDQGGEFRGSMESSSEDFGVFYLWGEEARRMREK